MIFKFKIDPRTIPIAEGYAADWADDDAEVGEGILAGGRHARVTRGLGIGLKEWSVD